MNTYSSLFAGAVATFCLVISGCGGGAEVPKDRVPTHPVSGVVTLDGKPLEGATVTFHAPPSNGMGKAIPSAIGTTDSAGRYKLSTWTKDDGATPSTYTISIVKYEAPPAAPAATGGEYVPPDPKVKPVAPKALVPPQYLNHQKSGLLADVKATGKNEFNFELKSQP